MTGLVAAATGAGCSGDVEGSSGGSGGSGGGASSSADGSGSGSVGSGGAGGQGSAAGGGGQGNAGGAGGSAPSCESGSDVVLAVNKLYLGDTNPDDTVNTANGWKQYGFNVDGLVSDAMSVDLCQPVNGASKSNVYPDGNNGIDNSFGRNVLPIFKATNPDFSASVNESFVNGDYTILLKLSDLGVSADKSPLVTKLYGGADLGSQPKLDGSDCWPVRPESLMDPTFIESASVVFDKSSVAANAWSSGGTATVVLDLETEGFPLKLTIYQARLSMKLDADHAGAAEGRIGGVLDTEELVLEVKKAVAAFDESLCDSPTVEAIASQIRQASDILKDGTQDPAKACNAISIGLGFKMKKVALGGVGPETPVVPNPCAP